MSDQADALRQLVQKTVQAHPALEPGVPLIALSGGKRGVGTSTIAWQLGHELARLGKRAVLVDANPLHPQLTQLISTSRSGNLGEVLSGKRAIAEILSPICERFRFLPGQCEEGTPPEFNRIAVVRFLGQIRTIYAHADVVILDAGEGMSPWVQWLWKAAQQILLVTKTEPDAVKESYATLKLAPWGDVDGKLSLVINDSQDSIMADQIGQNFAATCRQFLGMKVRPHAVIAHAEESPLEEGLSRSRDGNQAFEQTTRLLAAELMTSCVVLSDRIVRSVVEDTEQKNDLDPEKIAQ